jgi:H+/Cl- antiporter ClcA
MTQEYVAASYFRRASPDANLPLIPTNLLPARARLREAIRSGIARRASATQLVSAPPVGENPAATDTENVAEIEQPNLQSYSVPLRLWPAILLTGVGAGLTSGLLMKLLRLVQHLSFGYQEGDFLSGVERVSGSHRLAAVACAGIIAAIVLTLMRRLSDIRGPGLNEAIWSHSGRLPESKTAISGLLSIVIVGMGAAIGREAALKQFGALVGCRLSDWIRLTPEQRKLLVACGAGAGMAAAYNVPLGGALFTLEVLLGTVSMATALPAFVTAFVATAVSWLMLPNEPTYQIPYLPATPSLLWWSLLCGPLMGYCAVWFVRGLRWATDFKPKGWTVWLLPIVVFLLLGVAAIPFPQLLGNGKNVIQLAFDARVGGGLLLWLLLLRPLATMACLRAGAPGGLFTPTMTFGALLGVGLGEAWGHILPGADKRSCAMLGAGAVLAAATQAPISSVAFILELTYNANTLMVPVLLVICSATFTYHLFESRTSY